MDKISKILSKLTSKEKNQTKNIIKTLHVGRFDNLNIKKLKGTSNIFRVRKGNIRVIYQIRNNQVFVLKVGRRKETTYNL